MFGIIFNELAGKEYLERKIAAYLKAKGSAYADASAIVGYLASLTIPENLEMSLADSGAELSRLPEAARAALTAKIEAASRLVTRWYPLVDGETVIDDRCCCLTQPFRGHAAATPLLIRTTNMATMVHFFDCCRYEAGNLQQLPQPGEPALPALAAPPVVGLGIIADLLLEMAKAIGSEIATSLFDKILGKKDIAELLQDLRDDVRKIVREELDNKTVDDLKEQVIGVAKYVNETYLPQKRAGRDRAYLENLLLLLNMDLYTKLMSLLISDRYREKGIAHLAFGANLHLAIVRELANVDPAHPDPAQSGYMETFRACLSDYIAALKAAMSDVHATRVASLQLRESVLQGAANDHWWFEDTWNHVTSDSYYNTKHGYDFYPDAKSKAEAARTQYLNEKYHPQIVTDLQPYQAVCDKWLEALQRLEAHGSRPGLLGQGRKPLPRAGLAGV